METVVGNEKMEQKEQKEEKENIKMSSKQYSFAKILQRNHSITFKYARTVNQNTLASFFKRKYIEIDFSGEYFYSTELFYAEMNNFSTSEFHRKNKNGRWAKKLKIKQGAE